MIEARRREPKIFIVCGLARQGKDTVGSYIREYYEKVYQQKTSILQFSYYIKDYAKQLTGWDGSEETKPRTFLQELGTDIIRKHIDDEFFAHRVVEDIQVFSFYFDVLILTDGRFEKEVMYVKHQFPSAVVIQVVRPNYESGLTSEQKQHVTELGLDGFTDYDYTIINDGSLDDLKEKVIEIVKEVEYEH